MTQLVPAPARTPPEKSVLNLLAGLLQVAYYLVGAAFGLKPSVAGDLSSVPLDTTAQHLSLIPELVHKAHSSLSPRRRGVTAGPAWDAGDPSNIPRRNRAVVAFRSEIWSVRRD